MEAFAQRQDLAFRFSDGQERPTLLTRPVSGEIDCRGARRRVSTLTSGRRNLLDRGRVVDFLLLDRVLRSRVGSERSPSEPGVAGAGPAEEGNHLPELGDGSVSNRLIIRRHRYVRFGGEGGRAAEMLRVPV